MTNASTIPTIPTPEATCDLNNKLDLQKLKFNPLEALTSLGELCGNVFLKDLVERKLDFVAPPKRKQMELLKLVALGAYQNLAYHKRSCQNSDSHNFW